ncbi:type II toxin-antitoxin system VapC family toxin [Thermoflexus hugenholtzii]|uniref:Ribonuclease VapC n=1 Tax=Thermoflexus hugenholtzii JAD2 TaxID=877466 RepID=A0A212QSK1_9CHLR|nr:type II toxin-antitoxin system VapC family toxin [Thermoflexus hugenholtzii]SNB62554.1 PIN domain-containing protein [Thermoflexus hugenholtzii JAD2]
MAFYYFDASALVKYYVTEPGSTWVRYLVEARDPETAQWVHTVFVAEITRVEVAAGLAVIERTGRIRRAQRDREYRRFVSQFVSRYAVLPLATADLEYAADLTQQYPLKAYDAVQLAVALRYARILAAFELPLIFVSGDAVLLAAARAEGLPTDNPFDHVAPEDIPGPSGSPA